MVTQSPSGVGLICRPLALADCKLSWVALSGEVTLELCKNLKDV
jgi:hypothetical protein